MGTFRQVVSSLQLVGGSSRLLVNHSGLVVSSSRLVVSSSRLLVDFSRLLVSRSCLLVGFSRLLGSSTRLVVNFSRRVRRSSYQVHGSFYQPAAKTKYQLKNSAIRIIWQIAATLHYWPSRDGCREPASDASSLISYLAKCSDVLPARFFYETLPTNDEPAYCPRLWLQVGERRWQLTHHPEPPVAECVGTLEGVN